MIITAPQAEKIANSIRSCTTVAQLDTCHTWLRRILPGKALPKVRQAINQRYIEMQTTKANENDTRPNSRGNRLTVHADIPSICNRLA